MVRSRALVTFIVLLSVLHSAVASAAPMQLWFYLATNLQVDANVDAFETLCARAEAAGYSHVLLVDSKFARLGDLGEPTKRYMANVAKVRAIARAHQIEIVPSIFAIGYGNDALWHDPNLAEGLPVKDQPLVVRGGKLVADEVSPPLSKTAFVDDVVALNGRTARLSDPTGNARFVYKLKLAPFRCYHVRVDVETSDFSGHPEIKALDRNGRSLQWQNLAVARTQEKKTVHVVFNTLDSPDGEVSLYFGQWGDAKGTLTWSDWSIEPALFVNVLRRDGTPLSITSPDGRLIVEGEDVAAIRDPKLGNVPYKGEYDSWHEPPLIQSKLPEGTKLRVSWYHPAIIYDGQVVMCPSEPATRALWKDQFARMKSAWGASAYMLAIDELRTLGWDPACERVKGDAGAILADATRAATTIANGARLYTWSDMFDPAHNAVPGPYYLVRSSLADAMDGLDKSVTVVNWNFGKRDASLKFFADRGHRQIIAGYYDGNVGQIRQWLDAAKTVPGVEGVMYTTWRGDYSQLETFAELVRK